MRLVCPSCEAKYEVPDDAIPDSGRDVQCANCNHAWFQSRPRPAATAVLAAPPSLAEATAALPPLVEPASEALLDDSAELAAKPPVRVQDEKVLTILREEAEREAKARREKTRLLEEPRDPEPEAATEAHRKSAGRKKEPEPRPEPQPVQVPDLAPVSMPEPVPVPEPEIELKIAARRDLLPDVEEIKSTLQPTETSESEFATGSHGDFDASERNGAFRAGFLLVIAFAILAASVYTSAAWLSAKVPALGGPLATYVALVDEFRLTLDSLMRKATRLIAGDKG